MCPTQLVSLLLRTAYNKLTSIALQIMLGKFNTDEDYLSMKLYQSYSNRLGVKTILNPNYLPDFLSYLKGHLSPDELLLLQEYKVQTYLVELAEKIKIPLELHVLRDLTLEHLRGNKEFWHMHNNITQLAENKEQRHRAIELYHEHISVINQQFVSQGPFHPYVPKYPLLFAEYTHSKIFEPSRLPEKHLPNFGLYRAMIHYLLGVNPESKLNAYELGEITTFFISEHFQSQTAEKEESQIKESQIEEEEEKSVIADERIAQFVVWCDAQGYTWKSYLEQFNSNIYAVLQCLVEGKQSSGHSQQTTMDSLKLLIEHLNERPLKKAHAVSLANYGQKWFQQRRQILISEMRSSKIQRQSSQSGYFQSETEVTVVFKAFAQLQQLPEENASVCVKHGIPWSDKDYLTFLRGFLEYLNFPTNNRKIAALMGPHIDSNHVKTVKSIYLNCMRQRIERGYSGGGRKGKTLNKQEFLEKDINNFSMKWFEKPKKSKKKIRKSKYVSEDEESISSVPNSL